MTVRTIHYQRIPEIPSETGESYPLGRHIHFDSLSLAYRYAVPRGRAITSVVHNRLIPILDQGDLGSCVGNAGTGAVGTEPCGLSLPPGHQLTELTESWARSLYHDCTVIDPYQGTWPPTDTGTDGLSAAKVLTTTRKWAAGYQHPATTDDSLGALMDYPLMFGCNWYSSMDTPDANGVVTISSSAYIRGGHEFLIRQYDAATGLLWCDNSWGTSFGKAGRFAMSVATFDRLYNEYGDVIVLLPLAAPVPPPVPPGPTPAPEDVALWADVQVWAKKKGFVA